VKKGWPAAKYTFRYRLKAIQILSETLRAIHPAVPTVCTADYQLFSENGLAAGRGGQKLPSYSIPDWLMSLLQPASAGVMAAANGWLQLMKYQPASGSWRHQQRNNCRRGAGVATTAKASVGVA